MYAEKYTREELQKHVVSTAISYYNDHQYTDYDAYSLSRLHNMSWTNWSLSPEALSRSNYFTTNCGAFISSVYDYSVGYNFSEYTNDNKA